MSGSSLLARMGELLDGHRDAKASFVGDQVIVVVEAGIELHPLHAAREVARLAGVVLADRGAGVVADIAGLVGGVDHRHGASDPALANSVGVDVESGDAAFAEATAVVAELHPYLVLAGGNGDVGPDVE